jgi:hypothetical protein
VLSIVKLIISIVLLPFKLIAKMFGAIGNIFKGNSTTESNVKVPVESKSVVEAAVNDDVVATKKVVINKIKEMDTSKMTKKAVEEANFAAKLDKANAAAEASLENERIAARALAASLKAAAPKPAPSVSAGKAFPKVELPTIAVEIPNFVAPQVTLDMPKVDPEPLKEFANNEMSPMKQIQGLGLNGIISYFISEIGFWGVSLPILLASYHSSTGEWLNMSVEADQVHYIYLAII